MTIDKGIFIRNIYYMLTYAFQELKQNNYEEIAGEEFEEIHDSRLFHLRNIVHRL